jgi:hypothetical protein
VVECGPDIKWGGGGEVAALFPQGSHPPPPSPTNVKQGPKVSKPFKKEGVQRGQGQKVKVSNSLQLIDDFSEIFTVLKTDGILAISQC